MNPFLRKQLIIFKCSVLNRNFLNEISISEDNLVLKGEELSKLQLEKLKRLLLYAYTNCPFYHEKYNDVGLRPRDIHTFDDFRSVPVITKTEIKDNLERMVPNHVDKNLLEEVYTSGTTGVPIKIYRDKSKKDLMDALYLRTIRFWGCDIGTKTAWFWGLPKELEQIYDYRYQSKIRRFLKNVTWFNTFDMTQENMAEFVDFLSKFRPNLIIGYVSALHEYSKFVMENGIKIYTPRAIWLTAEPSDSSQRQIIEESFGARTYNQYGSSEILHMATECCERSGLHIHADSRYVEVIDQDCKCVSSGEIGNIVVTDLENKVMPLIRYKNDDVGSLRDEHCKCGLNLPLMNNVAGRIYDMITLRNGKKIYGHMFSRVLFNYPEQIRQFQVHQISFDRIIVRIVPGRIENFDKLSADILSKFQEYTENLIDYSIEIIKDIEKEKSGKLRYVISDV